MKDVFKYFKQSRSILESTTSQRAHELGYEYQSRGVWMDPKNGKKYKAQGTQFKEIPQKEVAATEPAAQDEPGQKKDLSKFKQDASQTQPTALPQIPDGISDAEYADYLAKQGTGGRKVTPARKKQLQKIANTQVAMMKQPEPEPEEEAPQEEPTPTEEPAPAEEPTQEKEPSKAQKEFDKAIEEVETDDMDADDLYDNLLKDFEGDAAKATERQQKMMKKKFEKFTEELKKIPADAGKQGFLQAMAHAKSYEGRVNAGSGKNKLGYADVQNLVANRDRLMEGYGDGSPETIKKFVRETRSIPVSEEFVDASFDVLPEAFKKSLSGKGQVTNDKRDPNNPDKAHKDIHYLGKDPSGKVVRGAANNKDRAKLMWKIYLEQGGRDAYTGLPLDLNAMDLEHVRGFNNSDDGKPGEKEFHQRENDDNFTLINSNVNQLKNNDSMETFFKKHVDPQKDKKEDDFGGEEALFDKANEIQSVGGELVKTMLGEGGKGMADELNADVLREHFGSDDTRFDDLRKEFRKVGGKTPSGMNSKMGKTLLKAIGLSRGIQTPDGRRTVALNENIYRGFLLSMASKEPSERQKYMDGWATAIREGNKVRNESGVVKSLVNQGLIDDEILNDKVGRGALGKVFKKAFRESNLTKNKGYLMIERLKRSLKDY